MRGDFARLADIAAAIDSISAYMKAPGAVRKLKHDAILYNLVIIGEAVKSLGHDTRAQRPEVPWRQIAGLRDLLAHEYFRIDMTEVVKIVERDLVPLSEAVAALLTDERDRRERFIQEANAAYRRAGPDPEQAIWDVTLMDGLEEYPYEWTTELSGKSTSAKPRSSRSAGTSKTARDRRSLSRQTASRRARRGSASPAAKD